MDLGLKGRTAVISGGSKGIGKAIARGLAKEGVNVVLLARGAEQLAKAADDIKKESGAQVLTVQADITSMDAVKAAADAAKAKFGSVNIVVNNAGGPIRRMDRQILWSDAEWMDDLNLKIVGALRVTQAFLPLIPSDGTGRVINISGTASVLVWAPADARPQQFRDESGDELPRCGSRCPEHHRQRGDPRPRRYRRP
jgi:NAD(P)-dependent dehydrogenase (short-subunit alcohol dehydrogenase family)